VNEVASARRQRLIGDGEQLFALGVDNGPDAEDGAQLGSPNQNNFLKLIGRPAIRRKRKPRIETPTDPRPHLAALRGRVGGTPLPKCARGRGHIFRVARYPPCVKHSATGRDSKLTFNAVA
jgi:hypothetical protein